MRGWLLLYAGANLAAATAADLPALARRPRLLLAAVPALWALYIVVVFLSSGPPKVDVRVRQREFGVSHARSIPLLRNRPFRPDHCCRAGLQACRRLGLWAGFRVGVTA